MKIQVKVNGTAHTSEVEPRLLLVHYLRDVLNLTGTHVGCDTSQCGACTIIVNGRSTKACNMFAVQADGADITHGLQCGFCTPGMIMTAYQLLQRNKKPSETEIRHFLEGNLCRCTGYHNIVKAIQYAAEKMA